VGALHQNYRLYQAVIKNIFVGAFCRFFHS